MAVHRAGFITEHGLWDPNDYLIAKEVSKEVEKLGLSTVRVSFADQHGILRGKTLVTRQLATAFTDGVAMTSSLLLKDTAHRTVFSVWSEDAGAGAGSLTGARDIILVPDPMSFRVLPWAKGTGWLQGEVFRTDGTPIPLTGRALLRDALTELATQGFLLKTGLEVEFHVLRVSENDSGTPVPSLLTRGFQYLTEDRYDQLQPILDRILATAEALDLPVRTLESEFGPSQCEVTFDAVEGISSADNMVRFRAMVKQVCRRAGFHATFMSSPRLEGTMASGWHLHQSLVGAKKGTNAFAGENGLSSTGERWVAGLLANARAGCVFAAPTVNGYRRFKRHGMAPDRVQWSKDNKGAMLRIVEHPPPSTRVENRVGEPTANPYLYLLSQVVTGLNGLGESLTLPAPSVTPYDGDAVALPTNLGQAIEELDSSVFYRKALGDGFVDYYVHLKRAEWRRYLDTLSEWEHEEYFEIF